MTTTFQILGAALALALLPGLLYLAVLTAGALAPRRIRAQAPAFTGRLQVVVPAHNESAVIRRTALALAEAAVEDGNTGLLVVADNCADDTAAQARTTGAEVVVRDDTRVRGKGAALRFAFDKETRAEWFLVVDADSRLDPGFLPALRRAIGAAQSDASTVALQARYLGDVPADATGRDAVRARLIAVAMMAFNVLRPRGRDALGQSCGVFGNGFAVRASAVRGAGWGSDAIVEDADQHLRWQAAGLRVRFVDDAVVRGELPVTAGAARTQRARWEGGRLALARRWIPCLATQAARGNTGSLEALADLLLPPLAQLAAGLALLALLPFGPGRALAFAGFALLALHVAVAMRLGGATRAHVTALCTAPLYVVWKLAGMAATLRAAAGRAGWVRTARNTTCTTPFTPGAAASSAPAASLTDSAPQAQS